MGKLSGKRVLITGGSAGLGKAVASRFAAEGASLVINYASSQGPAEELADQLSKTYGVKAVAIRADVGKADDCAELVRQTVEVLGGLDVLISNAGWTRAADWRDLDNYSEAEWDKTYAMNVKAHLFLFKAAKPHFEGNAEGGSFIITTSVAGVRQSGSSLAYSVSKHAAIALARGLALHQGYVSIDSSSLCHKTDCNTTCRPKCRINTVAPGLIATDWARKQFNEDVMSVIKKRTPLGDIASLEDCAETFLMLATSRSIQGQTIVLDGGYSLL